MRSVLVNPICALLWLLCGCVLTSMSQAESQRYTLEAEQYWQMEPPHGERFDASGLVMLPDKSLLTVNDRGAGLYRVEFTASTNSVKLVPLTNCFTDAQLAPFAKEKVERYDCEGLARDEQGRIYVCEEANRWILRFDPKTGTVERLDIDWSPVKKYFHADRNASFEGVAIGGGKLWVANERQRGRIIVVDLVTLKVERDFAVYPSNSKAFDPHYSDLCWFSGELWVLMREARTLLRVDPQTEEVLAEFSFSDMERKKEVVYNSRYPTSTMEGVAVDAEYIWLCTDNNGQSRWIAPGDIRPTLFKCRRPDKAKP